MPLPYVAYYRVSTERQGASGLGLDAQKQAVKAFISSGTGALAAEYTEVESGKRADRPQLAAALEECKRRKAVLVIAKLDRLARDVHFISGLQKGRVDFVCCDNPHANKTMLQMMAVFAEHEREMISSRTKAALTEAKRKGVKLGNPRLEDARAKAHERHRLQRPSRETQEFIRTLKSTGATYRAIADRLNGLNIPTPRRRRWHASTVRSQYILG